MIRVEAEVLVPKPMKKQADSVTGGEAHARCHLAAMDRRLATRLVARPSH
jgi:hypothetical protein